MAAAGEGMAAGAVVARTHIRAVAMPAAMAATAAAMVATAAGTVGIVGATGMVIEVGMATTAVAGAGAAGGGAVWASDCISQRCLLLLDLLVGWRALLLCRRYLLSLGRNVQAIPDGCAPR